MTTNEQHLVHEQVIPGVRAIRFVRPDMRRQLDPIIGDDNFEVAKAYGMLPADVAEQSRVVLDKVRIAVEETGGSRADVVKTNVFVKDLDALATAPDRMTDVRAPIVMVINTRQADGSVKAMQWIEECDWKACAIIFRLHELDHLGQARKTLRQLPD